MHPMLSIAVKAARRAGNIINRASLEPEKIQVSRKGKRDVVTDIDRVAEEAIIDVLREAYPDHGFLGEESGVSKGTKDNPEYQWIIDPLDGTKNFIRGFPDYAVSIALAHKGQIVQGVIYDPGRNELFTATRGVGAFLNDRRIRVSRCAHIEDALVIGRMPSLQGAAAFHALAEKSNSVRRLGSTVLELAYVACGRADAYFGATLQAWDIAAGSLLVLEAGGLIGDFDGEQRWMKTGNVVASSPKLFPHLVNTIKQS